MARDDQVVMKQAVHEPRTWNGQQVCSVCHYSPQPGAMKPTPWPCAAEALMEIIRIIDREQPIGNGHRIREVARRALA